MTMHLAPARPLEHAAHRLGAALIAWSDRRTADAAPVSRSAHRLAFHEQTALEARQRSWTNAASATPRLR